MPANPTRRVAITGFGVVSPIGCDVESFWQSLDEGRSGIVPFRSLPPGSLPVLNGGEIQSFTGKIEDFGELDKALQRSIRKNLKVMCREIEMGVAAAQKALQHSQLPTDREPQKCGVIFGCDYILTRPEEYIDGVIKCQTGDVNQDLARWPTEGLPQVNPLWLLKYLPNMPASHVAIYNDLRGPSNSITMREAGMNLSLAEALATFRRGVADVLIVGSTGSRLHPLRAQQVAKLEKLAADCSDPAEMSRPFDQSRDGMVLGEGAGALILEDLEAAEKRGARIYGELISAGAAMVPAQPGRNHIRQAVGNSLKATLAAAGKLLPSKIHIHAHGIGTPAGDAAEAAGIHDALSDMVRSTPVVAAKSYFGNLGAGSGAAEIIASLLAFQHNSLFGTLNYKKGDSEHPLAIAERGQDPGDGFLHISYSPQGQTSSVLIRRYAA